MSEKLVLIDGHSILNRAFYGVPDLSNAEGLHTNAVYGFLNILFKILEEEKQKVLEEEIKADEYIIRDLQAGVYFLNVKTNVGSVTKKIVKY